MLLLEYCELVDFIYLTLFTLVNYLVEKNASIVTNLWKSSAEPVERLWNSHCFDAKSVFSVLG
jgi:hypothetical protein